MKILITLLFLALNLCSFSQSWQWVNRLQGGSSNHQFFDTHTSYDNEYIYGVGRYRATATFYGQDADSVNLYHAGSRDVFIAKMDTDGNYQWVITDGGTDSDYALSVTVDEFENIYITGITTGTATFESTTIVSDALGDAFVAKYSPQGSLIWVKQINGSVGKDYGSQIECDLNGSIYIAGNQAGDFAYGTGANTLVDPGYFYAKMDYDGNFIWCKGPQNGSSYSASILNALTIKNEKIYIGGGTRSNVTFDTVATNGGTPTWGVFYFAEVDTSGHVLWVETGTGVTYSGCDAIAVSDSAIYISGSFSYITEFDTITVTSNSTSFAGQDVYDGRDAYLAKYSLDGTSCHWVKEQKGLKTDINYSTIINTRGNIVTSGVYNQYDQYSATLSEGDIKITAYTPSGDSLWQEFLSGDRAGVCSSITQDNAGNYYIAGAMKGDYHFPPSITIANAVGKYSGLIGKFYPPLTKDTLYLSVCSNDSIWFNIPNYFGAPLTYSWYLNNNLLSIDNDSIYTNVNNLDSIWCVISNGNNQDTTTYFISHYPNNTFSLGNDTTTCDYNSLITLNGPVSTSDFLWSNSSTSNTIDVMSSGLYWLNITDDNSCITSDTIYVDFVDCTSILETSNEMEVIYIQNKRIEVITAYPNHFKVFDLHGKIIMKSELNIIDVSNFSPGIYFLQSNSHKNIFKFTVY